MWRIASGWTLFIVGCLALAAELLASIFLDYYFLRNFGFTIIRIAVWMAFLLFGLRMITHRTAPGDEEDDEPDEPGT